MIFSTAISANYSLSEVITILLLAKYIKFIVAHNDNSSRDTLHKNSIPLLKSNQVIVVRMHNNKWSLAGMRSVMMNILWWILFMPIYYCSQLFSTEIESPENFISWFIMVIKFVMLAALNYTYYRSSYAFSIFLHIYHGCYVLRKRKTIFSLHLL